MLLTDYLHGIGLTGTKVGCGQGGCGACTVMLSHRDPHTGAPVHRAINACLRPLCALDGMMVTTTEGIGSVHDGLDPVQHCIAMNNGTQCGFCTPGFVMNAHAFLQQKPAPSQQEIEDIFGGNLCRCTGYRPILHAVRTLARDYDAAADRTQKCLIDPSYPVPRRSELARIDLDQLPPSGPAACAPFHRQRPGMVSPHHARGGPPAQETVRRARPARNRSSSSSATRPRASISTRSRRTSSTFPRIAELGRIAEQETGIHVGATVPIQRLIDFVTEVIGRRPAEQTTGLRELIRHASFLAGYQVRCAGSVAGNIFMTRDHAHRGAPFPSDLFTILATLGTDDPHRFARLRRRQPGVSLDRRCPPSKRCRTTPSSCSFTFPTRGRASTCRPTASPAGRRCRTRSSTPGSASASTSADTWNRAKPPSSTAGWLP